MATMNLARQCAIAPEDGLLRAIADGEADAPEYRELIEHLRSCESCRERSQAIRAVAAIATGRLAVIARTDATPITRPSLDSVLYPRVLPWQTRLVRRIAAPTGTWVRGVGAVAAAVAIAVAWPAVSSFADGALQTFRVQRVQPITIDPAVVKSRLAGLPVDEAKIRDAVRYRGPDAPTITITSLADAATRSGLVLQLPKSVPASMRGAPARFVVTSGGAADLTIDGPKLAQVARDARVNDAAVLARLTAMDGAAIHLEGAPAVFTVWGDVDLPTQVPSGKAMATMQPPDVRGPILVIGQMKSPVVNIPASIDVDGFRDALLKSGTVPPEVVQALGAVKDWRNTLPVPSVGGALRSVDVGGAQASIASRTDHGKTMTTIVWVRDGVLFGAASDLPEADVLAAVRSLAPSKS